jgi:hypothetical protein
LSGFQHREKLVAKSGELSIFPAPRPRPD